MELFVISPNLRFTNLTIAPDSTVSDLISHFAVTEVSRSVFTVAKRYCDLNSSCAIISAILSLLMVPFDFDDDSYG